MKQDIQKLYDNQVNQANVLNDIISITNVSRGLINENIMKINEIIDTISFLNETIDSLAEKLKPLYITRRFYLLHTETQIHHFRIRTLIRQISKDIDLIKEYLNIHTTGKITPTIIDPIHLKQELLKIHKQLPARLSLPEEPTTNIWHYYRFLTVTPVTHDNSLILMIKIPLIDLDSGLNLYKIYNLPIYHPDIEKSLQYKLEGNNLAITKDNKYATLLTNTEFLTCTLAEGHFCNLNSGLYHVDNSKWCVTALFLKDNSKITTYCKVAVTNITGPQANYLDQGHWSISVPKPTHMEIKCEDHTQVKTLQPPTTLVNLQPACSAFSAEIKLPPYFKQYSKGFHVALKSANLHVPKFTPTNFRIWNTFDVVNITNTEVEKLKSLEPAPSIPIDQLRAHIAKLRQIEPYNKKPWIYYVGGGSGSGLLLIIIISCTLYWYCKRTNPSESRSPTCVTIAAPEAPSMLSSRVNGIEADKYSASGRETVGSQGPVGTQGMGSRNEMQYAFASALLDQLEQNSNNLKDYLT